MDDGEGGDFQDIIGQTVPSLFTQYTITEGIKKGLIYRF